MIEIIYNNIDILNIIANRWTSHPIRHKYLAIYA